MTKRISPNKTKSRESTDLAERLLLSLKCTGMLRAGERVGVGVSGGADSIALLLLLTELREKLGIVLSVAHLNHKLRAKASDGDEQFVAKLAGKLELTFHSESVNVSAKAKRERANLEDTARRARYAFFSRLVQEGKVDRVAVAHTADDQAETVLAHILRGTGLTGLGGIHPETESVVRPLLNVRRAEMRSFLRARKQRWREDATNQDTTRTRARIRKKLLPLLEKQFQGSVVEHLGFLAEFAREDESFLEWMAREQCENLVRKTGEQTRIATADLLQPLKGKMLRAGSTGEREERSNQALTKRILRRLIEEKKRGTGQILALHIAGAMELARRGENGRLLQLPGAVDVRREHDDLVFCTNLSRTGEQTGEKRRAKMKSTTEYEHNIDFEKGDFNLQVSQTQCVFRLRVIDWLAKRGETSESGAVLDRDRLRAPLVLRNWRFGDRLQPTGHQKAHKLKRLFNEKRISRWEREGWPVLTSGGVIVWARGFPVAAGFAANDATRTGILIAEENA